VIHAEELQGAEEECMLCAALGAELCSSCAYGVYVAANKRPPLEVIRSVGRLPRGDEELRPRP
jgi:hypothetical protein